MTAKEFNIRMMPLRPKLLVQAQNLAGNDDIAEDLVQETMLRLWEMRQQLKAHPNIEALAMTILRNKHVDYWRRRQKEQRLEHEDIPTDEIHDELELISIIIGQLPPLQQQVFRMKEVEGYAKEEIMLVTGCTDESLRQNLSRARRKIKELFIKLSKL